MKDSEVIVADIPWVGEIFDQNISKVLFLDCFYNGSEANNIGSCRGIIFIFETFSIKCEMKLDNRDYKDLIDYDEIPNVYDMRVKFIKNSTGSLGDILNDARWESLKDDPDIIEFDFNIGWKCDNVGQITPFSNIKVVTDEYTLIFYPSLSGTIILNLDK